MARSQAVIKKEIINYMSGVSLLAPLVSNTSQVAYFGNFIDVIARIINLLEQLQDVYKGELDQTAANAAVLTEAWLKDRVLKFQYDATTPQVLHIDSNFAINYPTIDPTKRIITRCSVKRSAQRIVLVKVAVSEPPVAASAPQISALEGYLDDINPAGTNYKVTSLDSDKLYFKGTIYYNGQYSTVIQANVIAAINNYFANIDFNGNFKILSLIDYIQGVTGVQDIKIEDLAIRADSTPFLNKTYLVQNKTCLTQYLPLIAGYVTEETTSGSTFSDTLTFVAQ